METAQNDHLSIIEDKTRDKAIDAIVEGYQNEETRKEFFEFYRHVQDVYEIISPDKFLYDYLDAYENLSQMYRILKEAYEPTPLLDQDFLRKTKKLVQEHTQTSSIKPDLEVYEIDGETLKKLEDSGQSDSEKVMNLIRSIKGAISDEKDKNPVLISIGEKAEKISERFRQKQLSTQEMLDKLRELVEEINDARKQKAEKNIPDEVFVVYWLFKEEELPNPEELANELHDTFKEYPYFADDENHERRIKQAITQLLAKKMKGEMEVQEIVSLSKKIMQVLKEAAR
jgi:type I restriction enzyme R subunit